MNNPDDLDLTGLWVPVVTPFHDDGSLDIDSLKALADRLLGDGVAGLVALGTTGESSTLTPEERLGVAEICGAASQEAGRPLIVGAGTNSTASTIEEIRRLTDTAVVAAVLVVVPYYTRPSAAAVVEHFNLVADVSPVPIVMYNIPYRTGRALDAEALLQAGSHPKIIGLKQSVGCLDDDTLEILRRAPPFHVLAGDDAFIAPTVLMGGAGAIAAAAHICTPLFVEMVETAARGDVQRTRVLANTLLPVVQAGFKEPNPAVWKAALHSLGEIASPSLRRPMTQASMASASALLDAATVARTQTNAGAGTTLRP